jgi:23S rRNA (cytidine1920-2'-O)/16S rRNA (cytidine1409-2'-O)-methyltransferase
VALDIGASTGGFTHALLAAGAHRVYAVDAGYGQLLGSLRLDDRVVNLERTNLGVLSAALVPDVIEIVTIDLSYLSLAQAAPQLEAVAIAATAELIALVKPMYELGFAHPPAEPDLQAKAVELAAAAFEEAGWHAPRSIRSPLTGRRGAVEYLLHVDRVSRGQAGPPILPSAESADWCHRKGRPRMRRTRSSSCGGRTSACSRIRSRALASSPSSMMWWSLPQSSTATGGG